MLSLKVLKIDNCLTIKRKLSMTTTSIKLNKLLVSIEALNWNFQSEIVNYHSCSKLLWTELVYTALGGTSHARIDIWQRSTLTLTLGGKIVIFVFAAMTLIVSLPFCIF